MLSLFLSVHYYYYFRIILINNNVPSVFIEKNRHQDKHTHTYTLPRYYQEISSSKVPSFSHQPLITNTTTRIITRQRYALLIPLLLMYTHQPLNFQKKSVFWFMKKTTLTAQKKNNDHCFLL